MEKITEDGSMKIQFRLFGVLSIMILVISDVFALLYDFPDMLSVCPYLRHTHHH